MRKVLIAGMVGLAGSISAGPAFAAPAPGPATDPFPECPNLGYQLQSQDGTTSDLGYFDLNTSTFVPTKSVGSSVNAVGYSRSQRLFWGMRTNPAIKDTLVRIDSAGNTADVPTAPDGPLAPATLATNVGTVDDQDRLILHTHANELVIIDVDDSDGQVGEVLSRKTLSRTTGVEPFLRIGDWDFNPTDGLLYSVEMQGDTKRILVTIDPATGTVTDKMDLTSKLPDGHNYGAVYVEDVSGTIYVSNNDVNDKNFKNLPGATSQTFGIYPEQNKVIAYTPGAPLIINDGADCLVATDFGDAPDSYKTLNPNDGPGHIFTEVSQPGKQLRIGSHIDPDLDGMPTAGATGDDVNLPVNDEEGVPPGTFISSSLTIPVTNTTGAAATLAGWLDLNRSGTFDESERSLTPVSAAGGSITLNWPVGDATGTTYLRVRLYPGNEADPQATGAAFIGGGEIEDHRVTLGPPPPQLPNTGDKTDDLIKLGVLLVTCGGLGFALGRPRKC